MSGGLRVQAGRMRHRVTIQERPVDAQGNRLLDGAGQPVDSWVPVCTAWASVEPLHGRELFRAREAGQEATHRVRMRHAASFRDQTSGRWRIGRIVHKGRALVPDGPPVDLMEHGRTVEVLAVERTDDV